MKNNCFLIISIQVQKINFFDPFRFWAVLGPSGPKNAKKPQVFICFLHFHVCAHASEILAKTLQKRSTGIKIQGYGFFAVQVLLDCCFAAPLPYLGASWALLGASWASLGAYLDLLGRSWPPLGPNLEPLGRHLERTRMLLGTSWAPLGSSWPLPATWTP